MSYNKNKLQITKLLTIALAFLVPPLLMLVPAQAQTTTTKYLNGKIIFRQAGEIYTMDSDGTGQTNITNDAFDDYGPRWSPDGSKILFGSNRNSPGIYNDYIVDSNGGNIIKVTDVNNYSPDWSADGTRIIYTSNSNGNIYTINIDGTNEIRLTTTAADDSAANYSPDGSKIAFKSSRSGNYDVYTMNPDGSDQLNITNNLANDQGPQWSPDGSKLLFFSNRDGNNEIYLMNPDGSNVVRITNTVSNERAPHWAPNSSRILFLSNRDGNDEIYSMNLDGSAVTRLTNSMAAESSPSWQPLPYTETVNDDGSKVSTISSSDNYPTTDYAVTTNETLTLDGTLCDITVTSGGTLQGTGHACTITVNNGGTIAPGHSPGCITSGNLSLSGTYTAQLGGTTPCSQYDQLQVTGTVTVGGTLTPSLVNGFTPTTGQSFTLITNDGTDPVTGTFAGLSEGATLTNGTARYTISYRGGDGNDLTLTALNTPGVPSTGLYVMKGHPLAALAVSAMAALGLIVVVQRLVPDRR